MTGGLTCSNGVTFGNKSIQVNMANRDEDVLGVYASTSDGKKVSLVIVNKDVVPVNPESIDEWTHPPFSGYYDGERVWGRGSSDDKSGLIGLMCVKSSNCQRCR